MEGDNFSVFGNGTQVDSKVFQSFQKSFLQVQSILDQNRLLINEINQNHESKIPDSLSRNVGLIRELNNNIRRVVDLYADLSLSFTKSVEASSEWSSAVRQPSHKRSRPEQFQADEQGWVDTIKSVRFGGAVRISTMDWLGQSQYLRQTVFWPSLSSAVSELLKQVIFSKHALVNMLVTYWSHFLDGTDEYLKSILYSTILCHSSSRNNCKGRVNIKYYIVPGYKKTGAAKSNKDRSSRIFVLGSVDRTAYAKGIRIKEGSGGFPKVPLISPILLMAVFKELECADDKLKKMALRVIAESLSEEEIAGLKEAIPCDGHQQQRVSEQHGRVVDKHGRVEVFSDQHAQGVLLNTGVAEMLKSDAGSRGGHDQAV
ncbi:hypothetical protein ZIOFF_067335 [Zingiber officinale]|uniref:Protein EARLY FLOWERING 4 domain-containing protein n=1 Tax=Zingiber officinale TaxID=94328 RepID=A0A8J5EDX3_ZINOF|nr:hypothetical protein ZIOFF_067335 [Zingiber officinale]